MPQITDLFMLVRLLLEDRKRLMLENLALRQQLAVLKRSVNRPRIDDSDRIFWILMRRMPPDPTSARSASARARVRVDATESTERSAEPSATAQGA